MNKTERIYIRITPELKQKLQKAAESDHRTLSNFIEILIKQAIEKR